MASNEPSTSAVKVSYNKILYRYTNRLREEFGEFDVVKKSEEDEVTPELLLIVKG